MDTKEKALDALIEYLKAADANAGRSEQYKVPGQEALSEVVDAPQVVGESIDTVESTNNLLKKLGLATMYLVEEKREKFFDGIQIRSNADNLIKRPVTFLILKPEEARLMTKFQQEGSCYGSYDIVLGNDHFSLLMVPKIPSSSLFVESQNGFKMELFIVDSGNQKAIGVTKEFKNFMRRLREPIHSVLHRYGSYHGNVKEGLGYNDLFDGDIVLSQPRQSYDSKDGIRTDIRDLKEVVMLIVQHCQHSHSNITNMADFPEDLRLFFDLCDWLESKILDKKNDTELFIWEAAYYILHSPVFMKVEDAHAFLLKCWSMRGKNFHEFDKILEAKIVPNWKQRFDADPCLKDLHQPPTTSVFAPTPPVPAVAPPFIPSNPNVLQVPAKAFSSIPVTTQTTSTSSSPSLLKVSAKPFVPMAMQATSTTTFRPPLPSTLSRPPPSTTPSRPPISITSFGPPSSTIPSRPPPSTSSLQSTTLSSPQSTTLPTTSTVPEDSQAKCYLRSCRNSLGHHYNRVWQLSNQKGEDELNATSHLLRAVPEGVPLLYRWMVEDMHEEAWVLLNLRLQAELGGWPYHLCGSCKERWL